MTKNAPNKPTSLQTNSAPSSGRLGKALRWALVVSLFLTIPASFYFIIIVVQSDVQSQRGYMILDKYEREDVALSYYEDSYKIAEFNALNRYRMATLILREESLSLVNRGYQSVDQRNLHFALDLLREARKGHHSPWAVILRTAQTAAILGEYHKNAGNPKKAETFYRIASENYYGFSKLALRPKQEPEIFYRGALEYSLGSMQPQLALSHYDDYHYFFGERAITSEAIRQRAVESYYVMGEFQMMFLETANQLYESPNNTPWLQRMYQYGKTSEGGRELAIIVFEELEKRGDLNDLGNQMLDKLRGKSLSSTGV